MKHQLSTVERAQRIEQRAAARAAKATKVQGIRDWFDQRREAADKRRRDRAERPATGGRGVDRVPQHLRGLGPRPEYFVQHTGMNYASRRRWANSTGRRLPSSENVPHVNLARDRKPGARIRQDLAR